MLVSAVLGLIIALYILWVIRHKIKDIKEGRYCSGSCEGCTRSCPSKQQ